MPCKERRPLPALDRLPRKIQIDEYRGDEQRGDAQHPRLKDGERAKPRDQSRQHQHEREHADDHRLHEQQVAHVGRHTRQGIGGKQSGSRRKVVAEAAQPPDRVRLCAAPGRCAARIEFLLDGLDPPLALDQCRQPTADVASARYRGQIIQPLQQASLSQCLQHAEIEGRAANAAARQRERQEAAFRRRSCRGSEDLFSLRLTDRRLRHRLVRRFLADPLS